jgi:hypothetical protein
MLLQWTSITLTFTGIFVWLIVGNQGLGYAIFMAGGVMWFILQKAEKSRGQRLSQEQESLTDKKPSVSKSPKNPRQSNRRD